MSEADKVTIMLGLFGWEDVKILRFNALTILRKARGEPHPTWDSFKILP